MNIEEQVKQMQTIEHTILKFIDEENNAEEFHKNLSNQIFELQIISNKHKLKTLLYLISKIISNHYRYPNFFEKIENLFKIFQQYIKKYFTSYEIYKIYEESPRFLLFLISEKIIEINEDIFQVIKLELLNYLFPEFTYKLKFIDKIPENFEEKQKIGENDDLISEIIRKDSIEEFIIYVNQNDYFLGSEIKHSIFETNHFLIQNEKTTLIEYAAFFGSTQIFKYLYKNGVELTSSLWLYAENKVEPPNKSYERCIEESIKCHHNDITNYIKANLIDYDIENIDNINFEEKYNENIYSYSFHYYNFLYFPQIIKNKFFFFYACEYDYFQIVEYFLKTVKINIKEKIILNIFLNGEIILFNVILINLFLYFTINECCNKLQSGYFKSFN